ncbi:YadA-like family protein [Xenorhabdus koppenhoeferi]|uniref:Adhesin YadB/C n=1 Tax=Xenorhabdus koppenhoeferi TaxID=351659 RepID=A0A1I7FKX8_9GAMM|nr:YadA-like family protein [Xenorhabdus koppenhoeferi]SFU36805.1 adhesin YadB/C [Xenorhabdus koppenhoeferi]
MFNMKTTPRKLAILSVLISSVFSAGANATSKVKNINGVDVDVYSSSELDGFLNGKANNTDLNDLTTKLNGKANNTDLNDLTTKLNGKANNTDLNDLNNKLNEKATIKELTRLQGDLKKQIEDGMVKLNVDDIVEREVLKSQTTLIKDIEVETSERKLGDIKTLKDANNYTDQRFDKAQSYTDQKVNHLDNKVDRNEKRANAGIASVAAMSNIPYSNNTGFSLGLGLGQYRNGSAVALGIQNKLNENVSLKLSTSWNSSGSPVFGAGVGISW